MNQNLKYIKSYKSFDHGHGRTTDTRLPKSFKIGDKVEVADNSPKNGGKQGTVIVPTDLHKAEADNVKVKFEDGKSDYVSILFLSRIEAFSKKVLKPTEQEKQAEEQKGN